jgi:hypothetical protein
VCYLTVRYRKKILPASPERTAPCLSIDDNVIDPRPASASVSRDARIRS